MAVTVLDTIAVPRPRECLGTEGDAEAFCVVGMAVCPDHLRVAPCRRCESRGRVTLAYDRLIVASARRFQAGLPPFVLGDVDEDALARHPF